MGSLVLQGGAEFGGGMQQADMRALELAGGLRAQVFIIPAAAAPDNNHKRAGQNGCSWFRGLGAQRVSVAMVIDDASADDADMAARMTLAELVYLPGGFPAYLANVLMGSRCWQSIRTGLDGKLVLAGSSAGAMVLCEHLYDPYENRILDGLGVLSGCCVLPHHDTFGHKWAAPLQKDLPRATLIGIDEQTAMIDDGPAGEWTVYGPGRVTLYCSGQKVAYRSGERFTLPQP